MMQLPKTVMQQPFHFLNRRAAVSEAKPLPGSRSGLQYPLELLGSYRYNSFFKAETTGVVIEIFIKIPRGPTPVLNKSDWHVTAIPQRTQFPVRE